MATRNLTHGTLKIIDGTTPTPNSLTVPIADGDLTFEEKKQANVIKNRGVLKEFSQGEEEAVPVSWTITFERWEAKPAGTPSVVDILKGRGGAAAYKTTNPNKINSPYTTTLEFTIADVEGTGGGYNEVLTFTLFSADALSFSEGKEKNTVKVSGMALVTKPTITSAAS